MKRRFALSTISDDIIFYFIINTILIMILIVVAVPMLNVISSSLSSTQAVVSGQVFVWPVEFSLNGYKAVLKEQDVMTGYINTVLYTISGTLINVFVTLLAAYPLSRKDLPGKKLLTFLFTFTMMFSGGMIPTYLLIKSLGLINNRLVMIIPGALSVYNMIVVMTYFKNSIPSDLLEAAHIDGCSDLRYFCQIALPLSKPVIAVIALYYAVGHWNKFFEAMIYLNEKAKYPLSIVLRDIFVNNKFSNEVTQTYESAAAARSGDIEVLKYALIIIASAPIWCIYPFVQRFFINGVMLGSIKG